MVYMRSADIWSPLFAPPNTIKNNPGALRAPGLDFEPSETKILQTLIYAVSNLVIEPHPMTESSWRPFEDGATLGEIGSEEGIVVRDEEHSLGARITLERAASVAPFAITCGIYGWMMHTRFFSSDSEAGTQYDLMKTSLSALLEAAEQTADVDGGRQVMYDGIDKFIGAYP
jgi:hypothetical protein